MYLLKQGRILRFLVIFFLIFTPFFAGSVNADPRAGTTTYMVQETVVYITKTGSKYHKSSCRYLSQSKIKTVLKKAIAAGMGACKVCKP